MALAFKKKDEKLSKIIIVLYLVAVMLPSIAYSQHADQEAQLRDLVDAVIKSINDGKYADIAKHYHYPTTYTGDKLRTEKCIIKGNMESFEKVFGKMTGAYYLNSQFDIMSFGSWAGDADYWNRPTQELTLRLKINFEKEKDIFFTMQIVKLTPQFELKGIAFGVDKAVENHEARFSSLSDKYHQYRKPKKEHCKQTKS